MSRKNVHSLLKRGLIISGTLLSLVVVTSAFAQGRDADGSRLQAKTIKMSSTQRDTLLPPRDRIDWRSIKVASNTKVTFSVKHKPIKASVKLLLTDARGNQVATASSSKGSAAISQTLKPGVYYIAVSSSAKVSYSLSVN